MATCRLRTKAPAPRRTLRLRSRAILHKAIRLRHTAFSRHIPPPYPTLEQGPPPAYGYKPDQPAYGYQPQLANTTIVVAAQPAVPPTTATTTHMSPPEENHFGIAICALVFSLFTLFTCGAYLISIPALILSIIALNSRVRSQKNKVGISIGLNVAVVVCTVVFLVVAITLVAV